MTNVLDRLQAFVAPATDELTIAVRIDATASELAAANDNSNRSVFSDRWKGEAGFDTHATVYTDSEVKMTGKAIVFTNAAGDQRNDLRGFRVSKDQTRTEVIVYTLEHEESGIKAYLYHPSNLDWSKLTIKFMGKGTL